MATEYNPNLHKVKNLTPVNQYGVGGTDLGIPFDMSNGRVGFLFGDTFSGAFPGSGNWRSPVMLMSHNNISDGIVFSKAFGTNSGLAPDIVNNAYKKNGEFTVIPNDAVSFPETGRTILSYMSVNNWDNGTWRTNHMGLAYSDGGRFVRLPWNWSNNQHGTDVLQMTSMCRDGDYVYLLSTSNGRDIHDGLYLRRVHWNHMFDPMAYEHWTWNGHWQWTKNYHWHWHPIIAGRFGEPSLRRLQDGRWVISIIDAQNDRLSLYDSAGIELPWRQRTLIENTSNESIYGGFIHPWSSMSNLHLIISKWTNKKYGVEQYRIDTTKM